MWHRIRLGNFPLFCLKLKENKSCSLIQLIMVAFWSSLGNYLQSKQPTCYAWPITTRVCGRGTIARTNPEYQLREKWAKSSYHFQLLFVGVLAFSIVSLALYQEIVLLVGISGCHLENKHEERCENIVSLALLLPIFPKKVNVDGVGLCVFLRLTVFSSPCSDLQPCDYPQSSRLLFVS